MSEEKNTYNISVKLTPWGEKGYQVVSLHLFECLGGDIAHGELELWYPNDNEAEKLITDQQTGELELKDTKENGLTFKIPIFIDSRRFFKNILRLKVTCISDKSFMVDRISTKHDDIGSAIKSLYPGEVDIRTKSDINNNIPIYQMDETNYSLCKRLAYSFKKNSIFAFGIEGFMLKETIGTNSLGKDENSYDMEFKGMLDMDNTEMYKLNYNRLLNTTPFNPWEDTDNSATGNDYTDLQPVNCRSLINYTSYSIMGKDYYQLSENYQYNYNFLNSDYYASFTITGVDMPTYKIGDVLTYKRADQKTSYPTNLTKYLVASNEIFFSQNGASTRGPHGKQFEWTSKLLGIKEGEWSKDEEDNNLIS